MFDNWVLISMIAVCMGTGFGWMLRGRVPAGRPHKAELERLRAELRTAVGLQADKDARIATLEADLEAERTGYTRFDQDHHGAQLARRQFG